jgi:tetratricopeptide (TPR) repeat protein
MNSEGSWLRAHGKLWYNDKYYRAAWLIWPQALALLLIAWISWRAPDTPDTGPWARPLQEPVPSSQVANKPDVPQGMVSPPGPANVPNQAVDPVAPCKNGDFTQRIAACSALLTSGNLRGGDVAAAFYQRGYSHYSLKQYQLALDDYNQAISLLQEPHFYNDRGWLWIDVGKTDLALQDFTRAIQVKPNYALGYANIGYVHRVAKRPDQAFAALSTAIALNPDLAWAYENRCYILEDRKDWPALYSDSTRLIQLQSNNRLGYEFRGHALLENGQYRPAIDDFNKAISIDATASYGFKMRGRAYYFLGQYDAAMVDFSTALRIDPNDQGTITFINDLKRVVRTR